MSTAERVVEAARDHLLEHGILAFSMRGLAAEVGLTAPALYRYFDGKAEILAAVAERSFDLLETRLFEGLRGTGPHDRLARVAEGYLRFALEHPRDFAVLSILPGVFAAARVPEAILRREAATLRFWTDRVREAMAAGILRDGPPEEIAVILRSFAHGLVSLHLRGVLPYTREGAFERLFWASAIRMMEGLAGPAWSRDDLPALVRRATAGEGLPTVEGTPSATLTRLEKDPSP